MSCPQTYKEHLWTTCSISGWLSANAAAAAAAAAAVPPLMCFACALILFILLCSQVLPLAASRLSVVGREASNSVPASDANVEFLGRKEDMALFEKYGSRRAALMTAIVGGRSSGKTALINNYVSSRSSRGTCYIDGRMQDISTPSGGRHHPA
jgi:hypothetical protein